MKEIDKLSLNSLQELDFLMESIDRQMGLFIHVTDYVSQEFKDALDKETNRIESELQKRYEDGKRV